MIEARINPRSALLVAIRINLENFLIRRRNAAGRSDRRVPGGEHLTVGAGSGSTGNDELMRWKRGALVGLEHPISKAVLLGDVKIRLDNTGRIVDIFVLRIGRYRTVRQRSGLVLVRAIELAVVVHSHETGVAVVQIVAVRQRNRRQWNLLALGIQAKRADVHARLEVRIAAKEVVRRAILLHDKNNVLEGNSLRACRAQHQKNQG